MKENRPQPNQVNRKPRENNVAGREGQQQRNPRFAGRKRHHAILPPPAILEAYEALSEGATAHLLEMAETEQAHRHEWEDAYLRSYTKSHRMGLLFGLIITITLIVCSAWIALNGDKISSIVLAVSGFSALIVNTVISSKTRRFERKPIIQHHQEPISN